MYESEWVAGIGIAGLLVGLLLGILLGRSSFPGRRAKDLEAELETAQAALKDYRAEVYDQFAETARKFESLNTSYNDLHRHLASSASTLLGDGAGTPLLRGPVESDDGSTIDGDAETLATEEPAVPEAEAEGTEATEHAAADDGDAGGDATEASAEAAQESIDTATEEPAAAQDAPETETDSAAAADPELEGGADAEAAGEGAGEPAGEPKTAP